jgi:hypothetical protein
MECIRAVENEDQTIFECLFVFHHQHLLWVCDKAGTQHISMSTSEELIKLRIEAVKQG